MTSLAIEAGMRAKILDNYNYASVGRCIYCGSTEDLQNEHILPFGLSGSAILPKSTCKTCAKITGQVEQKVLRGPMWALRVYRELKSRTKHQDAPKSYPLTVIRNGTEQLITLPVHEFPILLHFPIFAAPAYLDPDNYEKGILLTGLATVSFGPRPEEVAKRWGVETISINQAHEPVAFARMIGKIAYAWAAAEKKLHLVRGTPFVLPAILGEADDIGRWVGTLTEPIQKFQGSLHRILIHEDCDKHILVGEVQLFSDSETPRYGVILGQI
jgi:hypothetical protein